MISDQENSYVAKIILDLLLQIHPRTLRSSSRSRLVPVLQITSQQQSNVSSLHDVRKPASIRKNCVMRAKLCVLDEFIKGSCIATWWSLTESNRRHPACKAGALPAELRPHRDELVGLGRLELPTSRLSSARSNQLSYKP